MILPVTVLCHYRKKGHAEICSAFICETMTTEQHNSWYSSSCKMSLVFTLTVEGLLAVRASQKQPLKDTQS